jgi:hypothetical protein
MPRRTPVSPVLLVLVLVALAVGAAASLVAGAASAPPFRPTTFGELFLGSGVVEVGAVALVVLLFALLILMAGRGPPLFGRVAVVGLTTILVMIVVFILLQSFGAGGLGTGSAPGNSTGSTGPGNTTVPGGNLTPLPGTPQPTFFNLHLPPGIWFALLAVGAGVAVVVIGASAWARRGRGAALVAAPAEAAARVREALGSAVAELDAGDDPRAVVIRLYASVLARVQPMVGDLAGATPEEIRAHHLERLGIRPAAATALTRLFEEARYSTHPMGPASADRARVAIRDAVADLDRRPAPS